MEFVHYRIARRASRTTPLSAARKGLASRSSSLVGRSFLWLLIACSSAMGASNKLQMISRSPLAAKVAGGTGDSPLAFISGDGSSILFQSVAPNLTTNALKPGVLQIYHYNLKTRVTSLVSVAADNSHGGNMDSGDFAVSSDGRYVAFQTASSNIDAAATNGASQVFVRDILKSETIWPGRPLFGDFPNPGSAEPPQLSQDGAVLAFLTTARLVSGDLNDAKDLYLFDLSSKAPTLVSAGPMGESAEAFRGSPFNVPFQLSRNGQSMAFEAYGPTNLLDGLPSTSFRQEYVFQRAEPKLIEYGQDLEEVAFAAMGVVKRYDWYASWLTTSGDGRYVVLATSLSEPSWLIARCDLLLSKTELVVVGTNNFPEVLAVSDDGGRITHRLENAPCYQWQAATRSNVLLSANSEGTGPSKRNLENLALTRDGRYAVFSSDADDLVVTPVKEGLYHVYWRDLDQGTTRLISLDQTGSPHGDKIPPAPSISDDGKLVCYDSDDNSFLEGGGSGYRNILLRDMVSGQATLVTAAVGKQAYADGVLDCTAEPGCISGDGRFVVFSSLNADLVTGDTNGQWDVFLLDRRLGATTLLSHPPGSQGSGHGSSYNATISQNGRYVFFQSKAPLVVDGTPTLYSGLWHVYDREAGTLDLLFRDRSGNQPTNHLGRVTPFFSSLSVSSDGKYAAFASDALNLVPTLPAELVHVYRSDMQRHKVEIASVDQFGQSLRGHSGNAVISPDGSKVAFLSSAFGASGLAFQYRSVYLRDFDKNTITKLSGLPAAGDYQRRSGTPEFARDGKLLLFPVIGSPSSMIFDTFTGKSVSACVNCDSVTISEDGDWLAYNGPKDGYYQAGQSGALQDQLYLLNRASGLESLVSSYHGQPGDGPSRAPRFTPNGRHLAYQTKARNLGVADDQPLNDVYLYEISSGRNTLLSVSRQGNQTGNSASSRPIFSPDSSFVLFHSFASDLVPGDLDAARDLFILPLDNEDSDHDGLDDAWERLHFGTLALGADDDADGDGVSNLSEFRAHTSPISKDSVFALTSAQLLSPGAIRIEWNAIPGTMYQVQAKASFGQVEWRNMGGPVVANGDVERATLQLDANSAASFVRVGVIE